MDPMHFQDGSLVSSQILAIGVINTGLVFGLLTLYRHYQEQPLFLRGRWWHSLAMRLLMAVGAGGFAMLASMTALDYGKTTLLVVNAGLLSLWYLELAMILGKRFFPSIFNGDLPAEITLFIAFVLAINGGYFTLMFIAAIFRSRGF
ncbi:MAG: hypothetical protein ACON4P_03490 [Candidatus Puniceispirillales bacterium]